MRRQVRSGQDVTLRGVMTIHRGGKAYRYLRRKGQPLIALPDLPIDHPDFLAAYAAARNAAPPKEARSHPGTIAAMCEAAMKAEAFRSASPAYRAILRRHIDAIRDQAQDARARDLLPRHIAADLAPLTSAVGQSRFKAWRFVCKQGMALGLITADPTATMKAPTRAGVTGHPAWTLDEVGKFRARWPIGTTQRALFEVLFWTGARISDVVRIGPGMIDRDGVLCYRQQKTGGMAYVPWTCALPAYAAPMAADRDMMLTSIAHLSGHMTFLPAQGRARSHKAIGNDVSSAARKAGIEKSAHGLRKSRAFMLADSGATTHQIGAWTGHESLGEIAHYTRQADRRRAVLGTERDENGANNPAESAKR